MNVSIHQGISCLCKLMLSFKVDGNVVWIWLLFSTRNVLIRLPWLLSNIRICDFKVQLSHSSGKLERRSIVNCQLHKKFKNVCLVWRSFIVCKVLISAFTCINFTWHQNTNTTTTIIGDTWYKRYAFQYLQFSLADLKKKFRPSNISSNLS